MSDWLHKWCTMVISFTLTTTVFIPIAAIEVVCSLDDASLNSPTIRDLDEDVASEYPSYGNEALEYLGSFVEAGFSAVKAVAGFVRKHPWKALTMFFALQHNNSPLRVPGTEAILTVTNINQTLTYIPDGPVVSFLPITVSSDSKNEFFVQFIYNPNQGTMITSGGNFPPGVWTVRGNTSEVNLRLSIRSFKPAVRYRNVLGIQTFISEDGGRPPFLKEDGIITLTPFNGSLTTTSAPTQPVPNQVTGGSQSSLSTITKTTPSSASTIGTGLAQMSASTSLNQITNSVTGSGDLASTLSSTNKLNENQSSSIGDSVVSASSNSSDRVPASADTRSMILNLSADLSSDAASDTLGMVSVREFPYEAIGGGLGGVVLGMSLTAALIYYLRKKYSSDQQHKVVLPVQQPTADANKEENQQHIPSQSIEQYTALPLQSPISSSYATLPMASARYDDIQASQLNDGAQPQVPLRTLYSFLPEEKRYQTSLPKHGAANKEYFTTIHQAAEEGNCDLISVCLGFGALIDSRDNEGYTPLHLAAQEGRKEACILLLQRGADKSLRTRDGKVALLLAQDKGYNDLAMILE